jgi:hypothetical protein
MTTNFLIALMFVTILTFGIAGLLTYLADRILDATWRSLRSKRFQWITLILLIHLNFFWHSIMIMAIDQWTFAGFLYMILGPVILFFAANYLLSHARSQPDNDSIGRRFYFFFAMLEAWVIGAHPVLEQPIDTIVGLHGFLLLLSMLMCFHKSRWLESSFPLIAWANIVLILVLRGSGIYAD